MKTGNWKAWFGFWAMISIISIGDDAFILKSATAIFSGETKTLSVNQIQADSTHSFRHDYYRRYAITTDNERIRYFGCFGNFYPKNVMKVKCCKWGCYWDFDVHVSSSIWLFNITLGLFILRNGIRQINQRNNRK